MANEEIRFTIKGEDKASSTFSAVGGAIKGLATAAIAGATALGVMVKTSADAQDHMNDLHKVTGIAVETLSELSHAAVIANADIDGLANGIRFMQRSASESSNAGSEAANAYRLLGVSVKDSSGAIKDSTTLMAELTESFNQINDPMEKTRLGTQIFGRGWRDAAKLMAEGSEGMRKLAEDAAFLGVKMSQQGVANANAFNDQLDRVGQAVKGASMAIANEWIPILTGFARATANGIAGARESLRQFSADALNATLTAFATIEQVGGKVWDKIKFWFSSAEGFDNFVENTQRAFNYMFEVAQLALQHVVVLMGSMFKIAWEAFVETGKWAWAKVKGVFTGDSGPSLGELLFNKIPEATKETRDGLTDAFAGMKTEWASTLAEGAQGLSEVFNVTADDIRTRVDEIKTAYTELGEVESKTNEQSVVDQRLANQRKLQEQLTFLQQKAAAVDESLLLDNEKAALNDEMNLLRLQLAREQQLLTETEFAARFEMLELNKQARLGSIQAAAELQRRKVAEMNVQAQLAFTSQALTAITQLTQSENEKQFKIGKAASIAQAVINTYTAAINAYQSASAIPIVGWVLGPIAAAAAVAFGMGQVSKIKSQQLGGQAHAGMTDVPNEGTFLLDKGERVLSPEQNKDLKSFMNEGGGKPASGGGPITIMMPPDDSPSYLYVRDKFLPVLIPVLADRGVTLGVSQ